VPVGDADFSAVRKVKAPLLTKAGRRLLTDERFAGKLLKPPKFMTHMSRDSHVTIRATSQALMVLSAQNSAGRHAGVVLTAC
jgi:hypothetical protein